MGATPTSSNHKQVEMYEFRKVREAFHGFNFFYVINHGINLTLIQTDLGLWLWCGMQWIKQTWDYGYGAECSESNNRNLGYVAQQHIKYPTDCSVTHKIAWLSHTDSNRKFNHIHKLHLYVVSSNGIGFFHFNFGRKKLKTSKKISNCCCHLRQCILQPLRSWILNSTIKFSTWVLYHRVKRWRKCGQLLHIKSVFQ